MLMGHPINSKSLSVANLKSHYENSVVDLYLKCSKDRDNGVMIGRLMESVKILYCINTIDLGDVHDTNHS